MALVIKDTKITEVKNLGWLLRNWKLVESFQVTTTEPMSLNGDYMNQNGYLAAHLRDGRVYFCTWASLTVCREWLHRPVFRGVKINWCGVQTVC